MWFIRLRGLIICSLYSLLYTCAPLAGFISIAFLITTGEHVTSFKTFTILSSLNVINFCVCVQMACTLHFVAEGYIAVRCIEQFMSRECGISSAQLHKGVTSGKQHGPNGCFNVKFKTSRYGTGIVRLESFKLGDPNLLSVLTKRTLSDKDNNDLSLVNVSASWDRHEDRKALRDISFSVTRGQMLAITGPVGSGKSSLLMAILGELPTLNGRVSVNGRIAYLSQMSWIFSGTIRDNILFGRSFEPKRYKKLWRFAACKQTYTTSHKGI